MMKRSARILLHATALLAVAVACPACAPQTGTVEGIVTCDGRPVVEGFVMMQPTDGNYRAAAAARITEGRYRMDGVTPGEMRLSLQNLAVNAAGTTTPVPADAVGAPETFTVKAGPQTLDLSLRPAPRGRP